MPDQRPTPDEITTGAEALRNYAAIGAPLRRQCATAVGATWPEAQWQLADQGWPQTRGLFDYCPDHRRRTGRRG